MRRGALRLTSVNRFAFAGTHHGRGPDPDATHSRLGARHPLTEIFGFDAYAPREIAQRIDAIGVTKGRLPLRAMFMLSVLAGAFIGLGSMMFVLVTADASLSFATARLLGGLLFSLGLLLVTVAGAELFTGNNLLAMAWASRRIGTLELLRNWAVVCLGNSVGACALALLVFFSRSTELNGGAMTVQALRIAATKAALPADVAFFKGVLCKVLVCMAVWMAAVGRSVTDRAIAIIPPVAAFVAPGFEHSVANMYYFPLTMLLQVGYPAPGLPLIGWGSMLANLGPVIAGNLVGGSVLVAGVYWVIYRSPIEVVETATGGTGMDAARSTSEDHRSPAAARREAVSP
jgi:formate transporter